MADVSWQTFIKWFLVGAVGLALIAGAVYGMAQAEGPGPDRQATEKAIARACDPLKNEGVDYHGPSWSESGRYEVTCSDGSQRVVYPR